jgi:hypothetical protein
LPVIEFIFVHFVTKFILDVQSFYWTYICDGPAGSCIRTDELQDETISTFEVADQTNVDLFCCASVAGYKNVNINMNQIGDSQGTVNVNRKQELDESWVVCANQQTLLKRTSSRNQETLNCELIIDDQSYSTFSSVISIKGNWNLIREEKSKRLFRCYSF